MLPGRVTTAKRLVTVVEHHRGRRNRAGNTSRRLASLWCPLAPFLLVLLHLVLTGQAWAATTVTGFRFGTEGHRTRVVLDLDQQVAYRLSTESLPDRLVVDLEGARWQLPTGSLGRPTGFVRDHHHGSVGPDRSRLVVEVAGPFRVIGNIILPPSRDSSRYRLVIDLVSLAAAPAALTAAAGATPTPMPEPKPEPVAGAAGLAAVPTQPAELPVIVIDPGHGGVDPGAIAVSGAYEKDIVLEMARELRRLIEQTGRYNVVLTREDDVHISLRDRITKARELKGQIFVSLHADSLRIAEQRGASVYTLSENASDEEAARLAKQENKADILSGTDLSQHDSVVATILLDLAQRDTNNRSIWFADLLAEELAAVTPMVRRHRRFAGFAVLKSPDIPSVLLELGYLSNADDARNLAQSDYRAKLSKAIVRALDRFFAAPRI